MNRPSMCLAQINKEVIFYSLVWIYKVETQFKIDFFPHAKIKLP